MYWRCILIVDAVLKHTYAAIFGQNNKCACSNCSSGMQASWRSLEVCLWWKLMKMTVVGSVCMWDQPVVWLITARQTWGQITYGCYMDTVCSYCFWLCSVKTQLNIWVCAQIWTNGPWDTRDKREFMGESPLHPGRENTTGMLLRWNLVNPAHLSDKDEVLSSLLFTSEQKHLLRSVEEPLSSRLSHENLLPNPRDASLYNFTHIPLAFCLQLRGSRVSSQTHPSKAFKSRQARKQHSEPELWQPAFSLQPKIEGPESRLRRYEN